MYSEKLLGLSMLHGLGLPTPPTEIVRSLPVDFPKHLLHDKYDTNRIILRPSLHIDFTVDQIEAHSGYIDSLICDEHTWKEQRALAEELYRDVTILMQPYYHQAYGGVIHIIVNEGFARVVMGASSEEIVSGGNSLDVALIDLCSDLLITASNHVSNGVYALWQQIQAFWSKLSLLGSGGYELEFCMTRSDEFMFLQLQPSSISKEQLWKDWGVYSCRKESDCFS